TGALLQAGMIVSGDEIAPAFNRIPNFPQAAFYLNLKDLPREVSAVHPSVCAVRRDTYDELGDVRGDLPQAATIADLCIAAWEQDYRNVYAPAARVAVAAEELPATNPRGSWQWQSFRDPYWNPNL